MTHGILRLRNLSVSGGEAVIHEMITSPSIKERIMKTLPTIAALLTLVVWFGIAIWLGIWPEALLSAFGVQEYHAPIETEIRAFYGGVQFGIATVIFVLWRRGNRFAALLVGGLKLFFFRLWVECWESPWMVCRGFTHAWRWSSIRAWYSVS